MSLLRLGSLNLQCGTHTNRLKGLKRSLVRETAALIADYDLFSLQEVFRAHDRLSKRMYTPRSRKHGEQGPYDLAFVNELQELLRATHDVHFAPYFSVPGLHDNEPDFMEPTQFGCVVAVRKTLRYVHSSGITYGRGELNREPIFANHPPGSQPLRYGTPASRSAHVVTILGNDGKGLLSFLSGHGIWSRFGKVDIPARMAQNAGWAKLVTDHRRSFRLPTQAPLIFMGDLNYTDSLVCFADILSKTKLFGGECGIDLNAQYGVISTRNKYYTGELLQADFALAPASFVTNNRIRSFCVDPNTPTDHALLTLEVSI